jgi:N-formylglutamate deformylase
MTFSLTPGHIPLLVSMPHIGTRIPAELRAAYVPRALDVEDTDWHLGLLYNFLDELGASVLQPVCSRYVIDLNRPPDNTPMYPGAANTELCPTRFFTGEPLYREGCEPSEAEIDRRKTAYWQPYHAALAEELARIKSIHGYALLWDAHSIRSHIPWLFEGRLPDLNVGTAGGQSADERISTAVMTTCAAQSNYTSVLNGRFKGGYITRHYGQPAQHIHAVQLELCQCTYMTETPPFAYREAMATQVQILLKQMAISALAAGKNSNPK